MSIGQINFSRFNIPQKQNNALKRNKSVSFGTQLVNVDQLKFTDHAKQRMNERGIALDALKDGIKRGNLYDNTICKGRFCVYAEPTSTQKPMYVVMDDTRTKVITTYQPDGYKVLPNGNLLCKRAEDGEEGYSFELKRIPEETTPIRITTEDGSYKDMFINGTIILEHTKTQDGYVEKGRDGKIEKVLFKDKTAISKCDVDYYYLPLESIIKHRGNKYTKDMPEYNTFKQKFFSEYE